ncbi:MAG TPA: ribosome biogenesis GTP-binding protein YihA/YsxC [Gammaproteobacteria bacterium]|nr:ribosome biogenesis GTP-binding protein YihA/YsxC [Gammaproteobacteria bacterium]
MSILNYNQIAFLKSANSKAGLPNDSGAEVAFGGRSNAGKSSALNKITGIHRLARTSKTPGRTQLINFFQLADPEKRLVDLPGYGYAKVPDSIKKHWQTIVSQYLTERKSLKGLILLMDIRHPLKAQDWQMIEWSLAHQLPTHILLTKADKLGRGAARNTLLMLKKELLGYEEFISSQLFSVLSGEGIVEVQEKLDEWLQG